MVDTTVVGGRPVSTGVLPPDLYTYTVANSDGDTLAIGRFDVSPATTEMRPAPIRPDASPQTWFAPTCWRTHPPQSGGTWKTLCDC